MTFADLVFALSKELGMEIEIENDACAVRTGTADGASVTILLQGFDDRGTFLATADLGEPPPERLERLFRSLLEANDLFRDTGGATLSLDPATGHVRLQRFDAFATLEEVGPDKTIVAFADFAATWAEIIRDFRDVPEDADGKGETPPPPASGIFA